MVTKWRAISISLHLTASLFACSLPEKGGIFLEVTGWQMVAQPWRNLCGGTCAYFLGCVLASHSLLPAPHALLVFWKKIPQIGGTLCNSRGGKRWPVWGDSLWIPFASAGDINGRHLNLLPPHALTLLLLVLPYQEASGGILRYGFSTPYFLNLSLFIV